MNKSYIWKEGRDYLGRFLGYDEYESREWIAPNSRCGRLEGFDQSIPDSVLRDLIGRFGMNGTPPPKPDHDETVDCWLKHLERWCFRHSISYAEVVAGLSK